MTDERRREDCVGATAPAEGDDRPGSPSTGRPSGRIDVRAIHQRIAGGAFAAPSLARQVARRILDSGDLGARDRGASA